MRKFLTLFSLAAMCCLLLPACSDDAPNPEAVSTRSYEKDAEVLSHFVDVDKSRGAYFINEAKKVNPSDYVINASLDELYKVNPANRQRFEDELKQLNTQLELMAKRTDVEQIVYMLGDGDVWVRNINPNPEVMLEAVDTPQSRATNSIYWTMELTPNLAQQANFTGPNPLNCDININMFGYKYFFFEITCNITTASKTPNGDYPAGGGSNSRAIIMSGSGSNEYYQFRWSDPKQGGNAKWSFTGRLYNPTNIGECLIKVDFKD